MRLPRYVLPFLMIAAAPACGGDDSNAPTPPEPEETWRTHAVLPTPRTEGAAATLGALIYYIGGIDQRNGTTVATVDVYDPATDRWSAGVALPEPRHHHTATAVGGKLYVIGGYPALQPPWTPVRTVFELDPARGTWRTVAELPSARGAHAAVAVGSTIHVVGGEAQGQPLALHDVFEPVANAWTNRPALPVAREHLGAAVVNGVIYAVGGRVQTGSQLANNALVHAFTVASGQWSTPTPMPTARSGHSVVAIGNRIYALGGERNGGLHAENEVLTLPAGTWSSAEVMPFARSAMGAAILGDAVYLIGGSGSLASAQAVVSYRPGQN